jgi:hypothetical protein
MTLESTTDVRGGCSVQRLVSCGLPVKTLWERINQLAEACDLYEKALKTKCTCETAIGCDYCDNIIKARELSS